MVTKLVLIIGEEAKSLLKLNRSNLRFFIEVITKMLYDIN